MEVEAELRTESRSALWLNPAPLAVFLEGVQQLLPGLSHRATGLCIFAGGSLLYVQRVFQM